MESLFKIVDFADSKFSYPSTKIFKSIDRNIKLTFYSKCHQWQKYKPTQSDERKEVYCELCETKSQFCEKDYFVYFNLDSQIRDEVSKNWKDIYSYYREMHEHQITKHERVLGAFGSTIQTLSI